MLIIIMIMNCAERTSLGGSGNAHCCQILSMGRSPYHRHCGAVAVQLRCSCGAVVVQLSCVSLGVEEFLSPVYDLNEFLHPQGHEAIRDKKFSLQASYVPGVLFWTNKFSSAWVEPASRARRPPLGYVREANVNPPQHPARTKRAACNPLAGVSA